MKQYLRRLPLALCIAALAATGVESMAQTIEEPDFSLIKMIGDVEIRSYQPVIQAVVALPDNKHSSQGFRRLASFIFGGNDQGESIAMTAPVQETLFVAKPEMAFTMPAQYTMDDLPTPNDQRVELVEIAQRTVAAIAFSGWATSGKVERYSKKLRATLRKHGLAAIGDPMLNQYNPPWTPPFKRRNEIVLVIDSTPFAVAHAEKDEPTW